MNKREAIKILNVLKEENIQKINDEYRTVVREYENPIRNTVNTVMEKYEKMAKEELVNLLGDKIFKRTYGGDIIYMCSNYDMTRPDFLKEAEKTRLNKTDELRDKIAKIEREITFFGITDDLKNIIRELM